MRIKTQDTYISILLFNAILSYVVYDESWTEPKKVFTKKEFSKFPYKWEVQQLNKKKVELKKEDREIVFHVIKQIDILPGKYRRKETQITLSDTFWNLVTKGRKKIQDAS